MTWFRFAVQTTAIGMLGAVLCSCHRSGHDEGLATPGSGAQPRWPAGDAGRVLRKAIAAAGGWEAWQKVRDVSFVSTLTIFDSRGDATSETIFLHKQPLHRGPVVRMESIGLKEEVVFGYDGRESWMLRGGRWVEDPHEKMFTEFHGISSALSFGLPFIVAEGEGIAVTYAGEEADDIQRWEKLRVTYDRALHSPIQWAILFFDADSGLLDQVYARVEAAFLTQTLWVGRWRDYRNVNGIRQERVRSFYPADEKGVPLGGLAAEQLIEHVQFNVGHSPALFLRPQHTGGGTRVAAGNEPQRGSQGRAAQRL